MKRQRHLLLCIALWFAGMMLLPVRAQNTTNLPTSMYGVGELSAGDGGRLAGMGNVGIALNRMGFQNTLNPAGITRMDTACFTFDVGASVAYARYAYLSDRSSSVTANPNRISLGFRLMKRWYMMLGAAPYSSVGYLIVPRRGRALSVLLDECVPLGTGTVCGRKHRDGLGHDYAK